MASKEKNSLKERIFKNVSCLFCYKRVGSRSTSGNSTPTPSPELQSDSHTDFTDDEEHRKVYYCTIPRVVLLSSNARLKKCSKRKVNLLFLRTILPTHSVRFALKAHLKVTKVFLTD